jgi:hypothetical protein
MNDNREFDLLADLAKLNKKYGSQAFEDLAERLKDPYFLKRFEEILDSTARLSRTSRPLKKRRSKTQTQDFRTSLVSLAQAEKRALLIDLFDGLKARAFLPTLREMQNFAFENNLPPVKTTSRERAVVPFVKVLMSMPIEDVRHYVKRIQSTSTDTRGLEGWSDIIFGDERMK